MDIYLPASKTLWLAVHHVAAVIQRPSQGLEQVQCSSKLRGRPQSVRTQALLDIPFPDVALLSRSLKHPSCQWN